MVLGADGMDALRRSHVAVFGLGGVGSYAVEALVRSGVGELTLIDDDTVALTNLNRQLEALHSTLGQSKAEAIAARCRDINPAVVLHPIVGRYEAAGVALSGVAVFLYQGLITLCASFIAPFLSDVVIAEMKCVGSLLIIGLSFNMLGMTKIKVMNYVPAVFFPILLCTFM